jgi:hypothetical protein
MVVVIVLLGLVGYLDGKLVFRIVFASCDC